MYSREEAERYFQAGIEHGIVALQHIKDFVQVGEGCPAPDATSQIKGEILRLQGLKRQARNLGSLPNLAQPETLFPKEF